MKVKLTKTREDLDRANLKTGDRIIVKTVRGDWIIFKIVKNNLDIRFLDDATKEDVTRIPIEKWEPLEVEE